MTDIVPDYMTALVGYRGWRVSPEGDLLSHNQMTSEPWPNRVRKQALCTNVQHSAEAWGASQLSGGLHRYTTMTTSSMYIASSLMQPVASFASWWASKMAEKAQANHHAPEAGCSCGIYAAKSQGPHYLTYASETDVWGEVYLWGKIQEYTDGYRAEFAYPKALSTSRERLASRIADRYGVPCQYVRRSESDSGITFSGAALGGLSSSPLSQNVSSLSSTPLSVSGSSTSALWHYAVQYSTAVLLQPSTSPSWWRKYTGRT